jgi:hypothetical protein
MARAIIGGLAFSGVISLFVVPAFYEWFDDLNQWRRRVSGAARERNAPATIAAAAAQRSSTR